jgi:predicted MFS family arabinose efflux permease
MTSLQPSFRSNIPIFFIYSALRGAAVSTSIVLWVIFLQRQYGFTLTEVVLLDIPFWIGKFLFEIPTGIVADRYGRRLSMAISTSMGSVIWLMFSLTGNFWALALAQVAGAMAATFSSGADEALLFESMRAVGRENEYARISARAGATGVAASMIAGLGVGVLAEVSLLLPVRLTALICALMLVPLLLMKETRGSHLPEGQAASGYLSILRQAVAVLRQHAVLRWVMAYQLVLGSVSFYAITFLQPYAVALGFSVAALGPVMVVMQGMGIAGSLSVSRAQDRLGLGSLVFGVPLLIIACLLLLGVLTVPGVIIAAALAAFLFAVTQPVLLAVVQRRVPDEARATLLSIQSLLSTVFLIVTEPALGLLSDHYGVHSAYLAMAALMLVFCVPLIWRGRKALDVHLAS